MHINAGKDFEELFPDDLPKDIKALFSQCDWALAQDKLAFTARNETNSALAHAERYLYNHSIPCHTDESGKSLLISIQVMDNTFPGWRAEMQRPHKHQKSSPLLLDALNRAASDEDHPPRFWTPEHSDTIYPPPPDQTSFMACEDIADASHLAALLRRNGVAIVKQRIDTGKTGDSMPLIFVSSHDLRKHGITPVLRATTGLGEQEDKDLQRSIARHLIMTEGWKPDDTSHIAYAQVNEVDLPQLKEAFALLGHVLAVSNSRIQGKCMVEIENDVIDAIRGDIAAESLHPSLPRSYPNNASWQR